MMDSFIDYLFICLLRCSCLQYRKLARLVLVDTNTFQLELQSTLNKSNRNFFNNCTSQFSQLHPSTFIVSYLLKHPPNCHSFRSMIIGGWFSSHCQRPFRPFLYDSKKLNPSLTLIFPALLIEANPRFTLNLVEQVTLHHSAVSLLRTTSSWTD